MPSTVQRHPPAAQTDELLLERIKDGEWPRGHKLPGETTLAVQLGVGRSTLLTRMRRAMIDVLKLKTAFSRDTDQEAHAPLGQTIADRDQRLAAEVSKTHLSTLKEALA